MSNAKIEFTLDGISFSGEGEEFGSLTNSIKLLRRYQNS